MTNPLIKKFRSSDTGFSDALGALLAWDESVDKSVHATVADIIADVRSRGDDAVIEFTQRFDDFDIDSINDVVIGAEQIQAALKKVDKVQRQSLETAAQRIRSYHEHQVSSSWEYRDENSTLLGQKITPLDRVGVYAPGGKATYPSSVLMAVIPAVVAGVQEVVLVSPTPAGEVNDMVLAAAAIAGVDRIFAIGGAQAVAALAYGTQTIPKVDKIVGPGNIYVATAKQQVFGVVDIDMIAGPSEILVVCDGQTEPDWIAMDLFSQAEHDENAQAILLCHDEGYIERVYQSIERLLPTLDRKDTVAVSLSNRGALIQTESLEESIDLVNRIAPEHLELSVENPEAYLPKIRHAGAIFMGRYTSESLGDYCAGPNHVLPTSGTARFSSPLGVYDYVKRSSIIYCSPEGASELGEIASVLARGESLQAHALSAEYRIKK